MKLGTKICDLYLNKYGNSFKYFEFEIIHIALATNVNNVKLHITTSCMSIKF